MEERSEEYEKGYDDGVREVIETYQQVWEELEKENPNLKYLFYVKAREMLKREALKNGEKEQTGASGEVNTTE